jgi:Ni/Co efflux regulator RcnB
MKKLFVYSAVIILVSLQACNNNSTSKNTAADSTMQDSTTNDSMLNQTNNNSTTDEDSDTSNKKNIIKVDAGEVPASVIAAFNSKYPNIADVQWLKGENKKGKIFYRVRWQQSGKKMMAMFREDGSFIKDKQVK